MLPETGPSSKFLVVDQKTGPIQCGKFIKTVPSTNKIGRNTTTNKPDSARRSNVIRQVTLYCREIIVKESERTLRGRGSEGLTNV